MLRKIKRFFHREPDFIIGNDYLRRWWIIPRNKYCNIYLHNIRRSDDDRALHDHPWPNVSIVLKGGYIEHLPGGKRAYRKRGDIIFRKAEQAHRLELFSGWKKVTYVCDKMTIKGHEYESDLPAWTLFITGPWQRPWGFHCPGGWKHWRDFVGVKQGEARGDEVGPGCGD